ncbi:tryptophan dimethylallyltransferase family protein [Amycolatopsis sp. RTGN1]|uniref:tryptophan dimethylallyltransferase family protein n=1 Tax=Amycolatopsis ponsaeliensis TaxID=2992142 RepID=UPI002550921F|nr:tryptophan dimethylallyltransferase family protein [Amycolatopsis sp. RTGN1]
MTGRARAWASVDSADTATYRDVVTAHLAAAFRAIGLDRDPTTSLMGDWADQPVTEFDNHHSFAANDGSPVEFSFAMTRSGAEARMGFEPLDTPARLTEHHFVQQHTGDTTRLHLIEDLFAPAGGLFSIFCATAFRAEGDPLIKVYLNPSAGGRPHQAVAEAMDRLGLTAPWARLDDRLGTGWSDSPHREIAVFALDLDASPEARVKLYLRHSGCEPTEVEQVAALAEDHQPDLFTKILTRVYGDSTTGLAKAPMTCLAFRGSRPQPASATLYCPLDPNLGNDAEAATRVLDLLEMSGIAPEPFHALATAISGPDLTRGRRLSWLSYKQPADPVVTIYAGLDGSPAGPNPSNAR